MERMVTYGPVFCDITWGAGGSTADATLEIATRMQNQVQAQRLIAGGKPFMDPSVLVSSRSLVSRRCEQVCVETMMHLTCTNMPEEKLESALAEVGIRTLCACMTPNSVIICPIP